MSDTTRECRCHRWWLTAQDALGACLWRCEDCKEVAHTLSLTMDGGGHGHWVGDARLGFPAVKAARFQS